MPAKDGFGELASRKIDQDPALHVPPRIQEACLYMLLRLQRLIAAVPPKTITGQHNGYFVIHPRINDDRKEDGWKTQFVTQFKPLELITDDVIDLHLCEQQRLRPSIQNCVKKLFGGGFYEIKLIKTRNTESKENGMPCVLVYVNCLSLKTSVMHTICCLQGQPRRSLHA